MTKIYGLNDNSIKFDGDINDEIDILHEVGDPTKPMVLSFDENTKVEVSYSDRMWKIKPLVVGHLFDKIDDNTLYMKSGLKSFNIEEERW